MNTDAEVFGYMSREVKLQPMKGMLPQEVYDPRTRAAVEETSCIDPQLQPTAQPPAGLTRQQLWIAVGFGTAVFAGTTILLLVFAGY